MGCVLKAHPIFVSTHHRSVRNRSTPNPTNEQELPGNREEERGQSQGAQTPARCPGIVDSSSGKPLFAFFCKGDQLFIAIFGEILMQILLTELPIAEKFTYKRLKISCYNSVKEVCTHSEGQFEKF